MSEEEEVFEEIESVEMEDEEFEEDETPKKKKGTPKAKGGNKNGKEKIERSGATSKDATGKEKQIEDIYKKLTLREQILLRPDTYIGSTETSMEDKMWVFDEKTKKMVQRKMTYSPGLYKIFDEILVNAADNKQRDKEGMDSIKVEINKEEGFISVWNNGEGIPCEKHAKHDIYVVELIFGHLLTSSNYDDDQKKVTGGRNGYGAKLCNIFSKKFNVEAYDHKRGKLYSQTWTENMSKKEKPKITSKKLKSGDYTKITFYPDFKRFEMEGLTDDMVALLQKRVYDIAGTTDGVKVWLNSTKLTVNSFQKYVELYPIPDKPAGGSYARVCLQKKIIFCTFFNFCLIFEVYDRCGERWEVCITVSPEGEGNQVSFVNSINTMDGGSHVRHVLDGLVKKLVEVFSKKGKGLSIKPAQVRQHIWAFVNCQIENPAFNSQRKNELTSKVNSFGSRCKLTEEFIKKVAKSGLEEAVLAFANFKAKGALKKTSGKKSKRITGIAKLDDANKAGTAASSRCTLILTEGDSAKTLAIAGLSKEDRDYYGVFPLKGKFLNVREATPKQILANEEVKALQKIIGLQHGKSYDSLGSLRYGKLMIMTDQVNSKQFMRIYDKLKNTNLFFNTLFGKYFTKALFH